MKIDVHSHIIPKVIPKFAEKFGYGDFISLLHYQSGAARMMNGNKFFREIKENCWNPTVRIKEYEDFNTQIQVISTVPVMFSYWAEPLDGLELSRFLNDHIADIVTTHPKHFIGLGTVPLQDIDLAIQELERIKTLGLSGVQIGTNINNQNLSKPRFFEFFEVCETLEMSVLIHPWEMMGSKHIEKYWLPWLVGMPAETARAAASMIFGGVFARYPKLRVCFAHGGGSLLANIGRLAHGFHCRPDLVAVHNNVNPKTYLGKFWIDSITHDAKFLQYALDLVGSDRICLGSDYPFPLGDLEFGQFIQEMNLQEKDLENVFYKSALSWLGISDKKSNDLIKTSTKSMKTKI